MTQSIAQRASPEFVHTTVVVVAASIAGAILANPSGLRIALAAAVALPIVALALRTPRAALYGLVVWLVALGLVRRLTSAVSPKEAWGDPLLLVGAASWMTLLVAAGSRGAFANRTRLTHAVLALWIVLAISAVNPLQGGLMVGLSGALVVVIPMAAFFVSRSLVDERMICRLVTLVAWLGLAVAGYGLVQTFVGFPSWDESWIRNEGYAALRVGGVIRPFASFSAASEYSGFLGLAVIAWLASARTVKRTPLIAGAVVLLAVALWYASARGYIVMTVASGALLLSARRGASLTRGVLLTFIAIGSLTLLVGRFVPEQLSNDLTRHQVDGLRDPFGEGSTLPVHIELVRGGIISGVRNPIGYGVGTITIAGGKYGDVVGGAEGDPGRAPFAAGLPGLVAYGAVVVIGIGRSYRLAASRGDTASLAALGFLSVTLLQWLNGGHYAVMFWPWLVLGWVDATTAPLTRQVAARRRELATP